MDYNALKSFQIWELFLFYALFKMKYCLTLSIVNWTSKET